MVLMKKIKIGLMVLLFAPYLYSQEDNGHKQDWSKMNASKDAIYEVYNDLKFGMFIHWGAYSKPAGIWKGDSIPGLGEWIMYHAQIPRAEYKALCKTFNPVNFNAEDWVKLARDAGMKYIVAMAKHHDGFCLYDSKVSDYDIMDQTAFDRDAIAEIYQACLKYDIRMGLYYSHSIDWMDGGDAGLAQQLKLNPDHSDKYGANLWDPSPVSYEQYIETKAKPQVTEIMTMFPNLVEIWYDFPRFMNPDQSFDFYKHAYNLQPNCLVNSRVGNDFGDYLVAGDNQIPTSVDPKYRTWETPGTLNNTWGYKSYDVDWKSITEVLFWIVEIASKGGNYLLNIGPTGDGTVPAESVVLLHEVGDWMKVNGEAIYGTHKWTTLREGSTKMDVQSTTQRAKEGFNLKFTSKDFWFTTKDKNVYAIAITAPEEKTVHLKSLLDIQRQIKRIGLLGGPKKLNWNVEGDAIAVTLPERINHPYKNGFVLKVELKLAK
jgi:alpha-L-fucosidase